MAKKNTAPIPDDKDTTTPVVADGDISTANADEDTEDTQGDAVSTTEPSADVPKETTPAKEKTKTFFIRIRQEKRLHGSGIHQYRRAGLVFTAGYEEYELTKVQELAVLADIKANSILEIKA